MCFFPSTETSKLQRPFLNYNDLYADDVSKFNDINKSSLLSLSRKSPQHFPATLDEALQNLVATLEDYRGQWRELRDLEDQVGLLEEVLRGEVDYTIHDYPICPLFFIMIQTKSLSSWAAAQEGPLTYETTWGIFFLAGIQRHQTGS